MSIQSTVKITLELTPEGDFNFDAGSEGRDSSVLDQARVLMLGIYALTREQLGTDPDTSTLLGLADWAEQVLS